MCGEEQRDECDAGGKCGHEHGDEPFEGSARDHLARETFALVLHQVEVVRDHHDAVARGDTGDGDEADEGGDGDVVDELPRQREAAHECERDIQQHLCGERGAAEVAEQQNGDDDEDERGKNRDAARGFLLRFEFALEAGVVARRELHLLAHFVLQPRDERLEIAFAGVRADDDAPLRVLAVDDVRAFALADIGDEAQRHALAVAGFDEEVAELLRGVAPLGREAQEQVHRALAFAEFSEDFAAEQRGELFVDRAGLHAVGFRAVAVHHDAELGNGHLLFEENVGEAGDALCDLFNLRAFRAEHIKVGAEDFHSDLCGDAAEHVREPVADGLADICERARHAAEFLADLGEDFLAWASTFLEFHVEFIYRHGHDVVVAFGASGAAAHAFHLGDFEQQLHTGVADGVALHE